MTMKVYVDPIPRLSIAMARVALALRKTAPEGVEVVDSLARADVQVLHAVSPQQAVDALAAPSYAVVQYALEAVAAGGRNVPVADVVAAWGALWAGARAVWSYYDLPQAPAGLPAYIAPLGVDSRTFVKPAKGVRDIGVITSGYVTGPGAEPIEEVALAAHAAGLTVVHVGPAQVEGMTARVPGWTSVQGISDTELAQLYGRARWVSGLRHTEGYELPAFEGLLCGARALAFDRPCYRKWLEGHAAFVSDRSGEALVNDLTTVFRRPPRPVLPDERAELAARHDWAALGRGFWEVLLRSVGSGRHVPAGQERRVRVEPVAREGRPRLVWVGDSPTTAWTGFGRASYEILRRLSARYDVTAVGTTHDGSAYDRSRVPYDVQPLSYGLDKVVSQVRPDVVVVQHDPWLVPDFLRGCGGVPAIGVMPIDGLNTHCAPLNRLALAVWWTEFAQQEARRGGYEGPSVVIPLGVDTEHFRPMDKVESRRRVVGLPASMDDAFIVGCVARNQPRKRLDLLVRHFAEWVKTRDVDDAYLYVQTAPTREAAVNIASLMEYEGLMPRLLHDERGARDPVHETSMPHVYSAIDVLYMPTQGEGFGLPPLEAMACGTPVVATDFAALGDWARPAAHLVPAAEVAATLRLTQSGAQQKFGVIGAVPDRRAVVEALDRIYRDRGYRQALSLRGLALAHEERFSWDNIGARFLAAVDGVLDARGVRLASSREAVADAAEAEAASEAV